MNITVSPIGHGRFDVRVGDRLLCERSLNPFFSAARTLLAEGVSPREALTMTYEGSKMVCLTSTVGEAARWRVEEGDNGTRFRTFAPNPFARPV